MIRFIVEWAVFPPAICDIVKPVLKNSVKGRPYMTSDVRGRGRGSVKSYFIVEGANTKHLMRVGWS